MIKGRRMNIGILILSVLALSMTCKSKVILTFNSFPYKHSHYMFDMQSRACTSMISLGLLFLRPPVRTRQICSALLLLDFFKFYVAFVLIPSSVLGSPTTVCFLDFLIPLLPLDQYFSCISFLFLSTVPSLSS